MDFFESQDNARRKTSYLVFLFICAVVGVVLLTNFLVMVLLIPAVTNGDQTDYYVFSNGQWKPFILISLAVVSVITMAMIYKISTLSGGGKSVAIYLGGRLLMPNTRDPQERQVLNVVEEMALAAGMPVPSVYLLSNEAGINAFAAGYSNGDAVVGITKGCMEALSREQLQGVIGHEFSHILNGDMRLNIRLVGILHGILFLGLIGRALLHTSPRRRYSGINLSIGNRSKERAGLAMIGLGLIVIGYIGYFFGGLIKAAVSRQREFLADAASVQFTRNPQSIADALKVIGAYQPGSHVLNPHAEEASHFFFETAISKASGMFATHPKIDDRISRIEPNWDGQFIHVKTKTHTPPPDQKHSKEDRSQQFLTALATQVAVGEAIGQFRSEDIHIKTGEDLWQSVPEKAKEIARDPWGAHALIYGLLLDQDPTIRDRQVSLIHKYSQASLFDYFQKVLALLNGFNQHLRLSLIELCIPALKTLSETQYKNFIKMIKLLVEADQKIEPHEWCIYTFIRHYLSSSFEPVKDRKPAYKALKEVSKPLQVVFSLVADHGHKDLTVTQTAFSKSMNTLGLYTVKLLEEHKPSLGQFSDAAKELARCYPLLKPRILKALVKCIEHDGTITPLEMELLHTLAAIMDCPIPPLNKSQYLGPNL